MADRHTTPGTTETAFATAWSAMPLVAIVVDQTGVVIAADLADVDEASTALVAWSQIVLGMNYVEACESASGADAAIGKSFAAGLRDILEGKTSSFDMEYARQMQGTEHQFIGRAIRIPGRGMPRAVITHTDITAGEQEAATFPAPQANLQSVLDTISTGVISFDQDQSIVFINKLAGELFGYRGGEVLGKPLAMLLPGWSRSIPHGFMMSPNGHGSGDGPMTDPLALTGFRRNGEEFPVEVSLSKATTEHGQLFTATIREATQRSQIEASERQQRTLAEALSSAAFTLNSTLDLREVLDHILAYVGLVVPHDGANIMLIDGKVARVVCVAGEYIRRGSEGQVLDHEMPLDQFEYLQQVVQTRQSAIIRDTAHNSHWNQIKGAEWVRSSINVPISLGGGVIGFLNLDSKIPAAFGQKEAHHLEVFAAHAAIAIRNAQLYEAEHFQRLLAEALQLTTESMAKSTSTTESLPMALVWLKELIGCDWAAVFLLQDNDLTLTSSVGLPPPPEDTGLAFSYQAIPLFYEPLSSGEPIIARDIEQRPDHKQMPRLGVRTRGWIGVSIVAWDVVIGYIAIGSAKPTTYSKHQIDAVRSFAYQVALILQNSEMFSELELSRSDLSEAQVRLARAAQLQVAGEIATGIAHQVNNPLTTVIAESYLLAKYLPPDSKYYESVTAIREAAYRAGTVIQRLVDFARARPFAVGPLDINASVTSAASLLRAQIEPHIARLTLELEPDLPTIQGSEKHVEDMWLKLLLNARDAIEQPGSGEITIATAYDRKSDAILVTIRDNGQGIAPDRIEKIFKPFYTTKDKGIGLGLSICKDTVAKHRGTIRVESTQHKGTTVLVTLPVSTRHI